MSTFVNFLPWRQIRRQQCLNFWGLCCAGSVLNVAAAVLVLRIDTGAAGSAQRLWQQADHALIAALAQRQTQLQARQAVQAQDLARQEQRAVTQRWQQTLSDIALHLPAQAWLTHLNVQQKVLTLTGRANTFAALRAVNDTLQALPGFHAGTPGKTGRDEQGRWEFNYQFIRESNDDVQP
ncbi:PilN domain-containing protein [Superficieibacter sp. HKU1]|uniref:PilN domain-containing protein n=1 Tax=Superficieibacter sp. HKU1 TaxID=3031919 RepID=UPI0023E21010|nr:PilN domain-containing protein [Superficieibacter sp. HKU1]WES68818.1 PilN domain-containing protein [Superficieibacter sp. HKU1]